jgi:hypothetical protein
LKKKLHSYRKNDKVRHQRIALSASSKPAFSFPERENHPGFPSIPRVKWKSNGGKFIFYDKKEGIFKFSFVPRSSILWDFGLPQTDRSAPARATSEIISGHRENVNGKKN